MSADDVVQGSAEATARLMGTTKEIIRAAYVPISAWREQKSGFTDSYRGWLSQDAVVSYSSSAEDIPPEDVVRLLLEASELYRKAASEVATALARDAAKLEARAAHLRGLVTRAAGT